MAGERIDVCGAGVDPCGMRDAVGRIVERAESGRPPVHVVTPNAHHVALLQDVEPFREVYRTAWLSLPDGMSLVWASRLLGTPLPEKVSGIDLFQEVCAAVAGTGVRIFLLGGREGAAEMAARAMEARHPGLRIAGTHCPPEGFEHDPRESELAVRAVRQAAPDILFVALGAPKQELWMRANAERLGVPVSIGVGATFDFVAGMVRRAPRWMQESGLEWIYRAATEPRRLGKRYLVTTPRFIWLFLKQYFRGRRAVVQY